MILRCFGSSSKGNCYALMNDKEILLLDAGVRYKDVLRGIDYRIADVAGVLVTHKHTDHSLSVNDFKKQGVKVFQPYLDGEKQSITLGNFKVYAFEVPHDEDVPCMAFMVKHKEIGTLLYLTDLRYCKYTFKKQKVETIICETNYSEKFANKDKANWQHVLHGHFSLEHACEFIKTNRSENLTNVFLAHLSDFNSNDEYFLDEVKKVSLCATQIATSGVEVDITKQDNNKCPFM